MNKLKWKFMTKYQKLMRGIQEASENGKVVYLENGIILDFGEGVIRDKNGKQHKVIYR